MYRFPCLFCAQPRYVQRTEYRDSFGRRLDKQQESTKWQWNSGFICNLDIQRMLNRIRLLRYQTQYIVVLRSFFVLASPARFLLGKWHRSRIIIMCHMNKVTQKKIEYNEKWAFIIESEDRTTTTTMAQTRQYVNDGNGGSTKCEGNNRNMRRSRCLCCVFSCLPYVLLVDYHCAAISHDHL